MGTYNRNFDADDLNGNGRLHTFNRKLLTMCKRTGTGMIIGAVSVVPECQENLLTEILRQLRLGVYDRDYSEDNTYLNFDDLRESASSKYSAC